jgi:hypothetical protein
MMEEVVNGAAHGTGNGTPAGAALHSSDHERASRLSDEWRFWIAENRLIGTPHEQIIRILVDSGHDASLAAIELDRLAHDPCYLLADRMTQRFKKLSSLMGVRASLTSLSYGSGSVERRSRISQSEFLERYYAANRPVILTGLLAGTLARKRWKPEYMAEICGDSTVQIMAGRQSDPRYELNSESHKREIKMSAYVDMILADGASNDYYLVANNFFFERADMKRLHDEVPQLPEYLDPSNPTQNVFLWFGPAGTVTPLHHDLMNVLVAQIFGRKRFTLIPPEQTPYLYNNVGVYGEVDCGNPDFVRHPLYRQARPLDVVLNPGDVLFIPVGWWHYVRALEVSIMISYTKFRFANDYEWFHPNV